MRGSVIKRPTTKRNSNYFVVVDVRDNEGIRRRRWISDPATGSGFSTKKAAETYLTSILSDLDSGAYVPPSKETLGSWLTQWLIIRKPALKPSTFFSYEKNIRVRIKPALGALPLQKVTAVHLDRLYSELLVSGRVDKKKGAGLSPRTVAYIATILKRALKDATRKGLIKVNPADAADAPRNRSMAPGATKAWQKDELAAFLVGSADHPLGPIWAFLASTGCRRSEALGLRWSDVDFELSRVSIVQSVQKIAGKIYFDTVKTDASKRAVSLDRDAAIMLRELRKDQLKQRLVMGSAWAEHNLVFTGPTGEPLYPDRITRAFSTEVLRLKLPVITLHGLRHTWATIALREGIHPKLVQERLGHANVGITLGIYSHVAPTMHDDAAETVARAVREARLHA
ncbi:MAG TPA: site-specific integrase [Candidatus Nanopelagicaceae bacterium]|nr:site-specific integrase [Candidatus Nanopelagicaceae bacterium]